MRADLHPICATSRRPGLFMDQRKISLIIIIIISCSATAAAREDIRNEFPPCRSDPAPSILDPLT